MLESLEASLGNKVQNPSFAGLLNLLRCAIDDSGNLSIVKDAVLEELMLDVSLHSPEEIIHLLDLFLGTDSSI